VLGLGKHKHGWTFLLPVQAFEGMGRQAGDRGRDEHQPNLRGVPCDLGQRGFRSALVMAHMAFHAREGEAADIVRIAEQYDFHVRRPRIMIAMIRP